MKTKLIIIKKVLKEVETITPNLILFTLLYGIFSSLLPFFNIYIAGLVVNSIINQTGKEATLIITLVVLNFFTHIIAKIFQKIKVQKRTLFVRLYGSKMDHKLQNIDFKDLEGQEIKNMYQYIKELQIVSRRGIVYLPESLEKIVQEFFTILFSIGIMFTAFTTFGGTVIDIKSFIASPYFSVIVLVFCGFSTYVSTKYNIKSSNQLEKLVGTFLPINRKFEFYIHNVILEPNHGQEIRIYEQGDMIVEEGISKILGVANDFNNILSKSKIKCFLVDNVMNTILNIFVYTFVIVKAYIGLFEIGNIIQYVGVISRFLTSVNNLTTTISDIGASYEPYKRYFDFMEFKSTMYQGSLPVEKRVLCVGGDTDYQIEFKNVSFKYPNTDNYILKNINFKFKIGGKLAIVGTNGSGKTTLIKLLVRFYDPTEGEILLNGINIRKYDYYEYMSIFSVVFQDFKLFPFSIAENVASCVNYDKNRVEECLIKSGFGDKLAELENGITTVMGTETDENGINLSGGEKQKIALARAIYKNAPFIVLDEPTSALDPISEYEIYSKFNEQHQSMNFVGERTTVYISHRLASCRFCENIIVFNNGELVENGNHDNLLEKSGLYRKMWYAQAEYYNK